MKKQFLAFLTVGISIMGTTIFLSLPSEAQSSPSFQNTLTIGGTELITLRAETQASVDKRANILYDRLVYILSDPKLSNRDVHIQKTSSEIAIYVKNRLLVTVTPQDALYNQTTPEKQAQQWSKRLSETLPILKVSDFPAKSL
jgi:hypothetical protein